jgi:hypothetical protein
MKSLTRWLRSLGPAGAVANARRSVSALRVDDGRVEALARRLAAAAPPAARTAGGQRRSA